MHRRNERISNSLGLLLMAALMFTACGETQFGGENKEKPLIQIDDPVKEDPDPGIPKDIDPMNEPDIEKYDIADREKLQLNWLWDCGQAPTPVDRQQIVKHSILGGGNHQIGSIKQKAVSLTVKGSICHSQVTKRDIVLIIDKSGSMGEESPIWENDWIGNDPKLDDCERKKATKAIVANLKMEKDVQLGVVTFNNRIKDQANLLPADQFEKDLVKDKVLCGGSGGTNYTLALNAAAEILKNGRADATKELYFITDGQPEDKTEALKVVNELKKTVSIATVMIGDEDDSLLKNEIATLDDKGNPLHGTAKDASELTAILEKLVASEIVGATFSYRPLGSTGEWKQRDLWKYSEDLKFKLPPFRFVPGVYDTGIEFSFEYRDSHQQKTENVGQISWKR